MEHTYLEGHCHCERVRWTFRGPIESATACNCTICRRYGTLWAYGCVNEEIHVYGETKSYDRGGKSLDFEFCANCACVVSWRGKETNEKGQRRIAVNLRLVTDPAKVMDFWIDHFDGLERFEDLPRDGRKIKDIWF